MVWIGRFDRLEPKRRCKHNQLLEIREFTISGRRSGLTADQVYLCFEVKHQLQIEVGRYARIPLEE